MLSSLFAMLIIMLVVASFPLFIIADVCASLYRAQQEQTRRVARHR